MTTQGVAGIAGIVFAVGLIVVGFLVYFDQPYYTDSIESIRAHFTDKATTIAVADWFASLLFVFGFLLFASGLRSALRDSDHDGTWSRLSFAGAVVSTALAGSGVFLATFTLNGFDELSDGVVHAFMRADAILYSVILPWGFALFVGSACVVLARSGTFSRWLSWFGFAVTAALVISALWPVDGDPEGALATIGYIGLLAALVWIIGVGVEMVRNQT